MSAHLCGPRQNEDWTKIIGSRCWKSFGAPAAFAGSIQKKHVPFFLWIPELEHSDLPVNRLCPRKVSSQVGLFSDGGRLDVFEAAVASLAIL